MFENQNIAHKCLIKKISELTHTDLASCFLFLQCLEHTTSSVLSGDQLLQGNNWPQVKSVLKAHKEASQVIKVDRVDTLSPGRRRMWLGTVAGLERTPRE